MAIHQHLADVRKNAITPEAGATVEEVRDLLAGVRKVTNVALVRHAARTRRAPSLSPGQSFSKATVNAERWHILLPSDKVYHNHPKRLAEMETHYTIYHPGS